MLLRTQLEIAAKKKALILQNLNSLSNAYTKFGTLFRKKRSGAPIGIIVGHYLLVNPNNKITTRLTNRYGFLGASAIESSRLNIDITKLSDNEICTYVWCSELNKYAKEFSTYTYPWKLGYAKLYLGNYFTYYWDKLQTKSYNNFLDFCENRGNAKFKHQVFHDLYFVNEIQKLIGDDISTTETSPEIGDAFRRKLV